MSGAFRTPSGGRIDRSKTLSFTFDGKRFDGFAGDTLASALIANGVHLMGRSFKYHRPRGLVSVGVDEPNALVSIDAGTGRVTPNLRAPQVELYDGLVARSQNAWPSLEYDVGAINSAAFAAVSRRLLLQDLHRAAGRVGAHLRAAHPSRGGPRRRALGRPIPTATASPTAIAKSPSSAPARQGWRLRSLRRAAASRVILFDDQPEFGGSLLGETRASIDGLPAADWVARTLAELERRPT